MDSTEGIQNSFDDRVITLFKSVQLVTANSFTPAKVDGSFRPLEQNDYRDNVTFVECNLREINVNLSALVTLLRDHSVPDDLFKHFGNDFIAPLILLCAEHRTCELWNCEGTVKIADEILQSLCMLFGCNDISVILLEGSTFVGKKCGALLKTCLLSLRPKLLKETWKTFPAAVACYQWILLQVKAPYMCDYLSSVLPTALIVVDDFQTENQLRGILCLQHIVENVTRAELGQYGQGDVILQALQRILYEREAALVGPLVSCLSLLLDKLERPHHHLDNDHSWCRFDEVLEVVLRNMEMENRVALRQAYLKTLPCLLEVAGVIVVRWSKRLLHILCEYAEVAGQAERGLAEAALQSLRMYMTLAHGRLHHHAATLYSILLRLLYDITMPARTQYSQEDEALVQLVQECLSLLAQSAPGEAKTIAMDLQTKARFNKKFCDVTDLVFTPFCN